MPPARPGFAAAVAGLLDGDRRLRRRCASTWRRSSRSARCCTAARSWPSATTRSGAFVEAHRDDGRPGRRRRSSSAAGAHPGVGGVPRPDRAGPPGAATWRPCGTASTCSSCRRVPRVPTVAEVQRRADRRQLDARHVHELREPARPVRASRCPSGRARPDAPAGQPHAHRPGVERRRCWSAWPRRLRGTPASPRTSVMSGAPSAATARTGSRRRRSRRRARRGRCTAATGSRRRTRRSRRRRAPTPRPRWPGARAPSAVRTRPGLGGTVSSAHRR